MPDTQKFTDNFMTLLATTSPQFKINGDPGFDAQVRMCRLLRSSGLLDWTSTVGNDSTKAFEALFSENTFRNSDKFIRWCMGGQLDNIFNDMDRAGIKRENLLEAMLSSWDRVLQHKKKENAKRAWDLSTYNDAHFNVFRTFVRNAPENVIVTGSETKKNAGEALILHMENIRASESPISFNISSLVSDVTERFNRSLTEKEIQFFGQHLDRDTLRTLAGKGIKESHKIKIKGCTTTTEVSLVALACMKGFGRDVQEVYKEHDNQNTSKWTALKRRGDSYAAQTKKEIRSLLNDLGACEKTKDPRSLRDEYGIPMDWWCFNKNSAWMKEMVERSVSKTKKCTLTMTDNAGHGLCFHMYPRLFAEQGDIFIPDELVSPENEMLDGEGLIAQWFKDDEVIENHVMNPVVSMTNSLGNLSDGLEKWQAKGGAFMPAEMWYMKPETAKKIAKRCARITPDQGRFLVSLLRGYLYKDQFTQQQFSSQRENMWNIANSRPEWRYLSGVMAALLLRDAKLYLSEEVRGAQRRKAQARRWSSRSDTLTDLSPLISFVKSTMDGLQNIKWEPIDEVTDTINQSITLDSEWEAIFSHMDEDHAEAIKELFLLVKQRMIAKERSDKVDSEIKAKPLSRKRKAKL